MKNVTLRLQERMRAYPADVWLLGLGSFINIAGLSFLWPINSIYIHLDLGQTMTVAGLVLMVYSATGFFGSFFAGWLFDRVGFLPVMAASIGVSACIICLPGVHQSFPLYVFVMAIFGMTCAMPFPVMNALNGQVWPEGGRRGFNFLYVANNLGVAVGTAAGGLIAAWSYQAVFFAIALFFVVFLILTLTAYRKRFGALHANRKRAAAESTVPSHVMPSVPWIAVGILLFGFVFAWLVYVQWQSTISVYMQRLGFPLPWYSLLWTLNGILIFALQPLVGWVTRRLRQLGVQMLIGVALFAVAFFMLSLSVRYGAFVAAMVVTTVGEMFIWPAVPAAIAQMAPAGRMGSLQGLGNAAAICGRMLGPVIGGWLYDHTTIHLALMLFCLLLALPFICFIIYGRLDRIADHPLGMK